ncbi:MAG: BatA domain-containing protein [Planctomycetaceae bacterium]|nr:BatA domain-containing protein [Planctomycetaceae bacterium]
MQFLNQGLAFGAIAAAIPLIIHLLNRSRFRTVDWGAMHLLESIIRVNHRRFQIEQWILLLIRCLIPALLAMTLARPVLTGAGLLQGDAPVSLVILLDNSYSMDSVSGNGTRFQEAVAEAMQVIRAVPRGSEVSVILTGGRPIPVFDRPITDVDSIVRRLKQLNGGYGASDLPAAMDEAITTLGRMTHARRELMLISDFQPADWKQLTSDGAALLQRRLTSLDVPPALTFLPVGNAITANISADAIDYPRHAIGVEQQLPVRVTIRNHSAVPVENTRVTLQVDGKEADVAQVSLPAAGDTQVFFPVEFSAAGSHVLEVRVAADDGLPSDNRIAAVVTVWDTIPVVLVDGDPSSEPLAGETDFLSVALTPYTFGRMRLTDLVTTRTIPPTAISDEVLRTARVVVLANVSKLEPPQLQLLTDWVIHGGSVLVTSGNRLDINWYNQTLFAAGTGMLPASFGLSRGTADGQTAATHIVAQHFEHATVEFFNEAQNGDLSTAEIRQWYELLPAATTDGTVADTSANNTETGPENTPARPAAIVIARLESGDPLLVERPFGEGTVIQLATAIDDDWSDLPLRPFYVPLMQQIVTTMAARISPPRNIAAGEPAIALLSSDELLPADSSGTSTSAADISAEIPGRTIAVVSPDGSRHTLQTVARGRLQMAQFDRTERPGIYSMSLPTAATIHFVAETDRRESVPQLMSPDELNKLADSLSATVTRSSDDWLELDRLRRHGREIWKYLLSALLIVMFLEVILQQRFARVRL